MQRPFFITNFVKMNLAIDIGNTLAKLAVIDDGQVVDFQKTEKIDSAFVEKILEENPEIEAAIIVSTGEYETAWEQMLEKRMKRFIRFGAETPIPIENGYATPQTLGLDRLAAAVAANALYPNSNVLIVDFGTAITVDFVSAEGRFLGGNISPGAATRFRALHHFTKRLPLCELDEESVRLLGNSTQTAIESGVVNGIVYEIEGYIRDLQQRYNNLRIIFTGGESDFFAKRLKNTIFATYDLVAYGLNRILEYNAK